MNIPRTVIGAVRRAGLSAILAFTSCQALADIDSDLMVLSKLSVSALQCSIYASDKNESKRLLELGLKSGQKYLALAAGNRDALERVYMRIPGTYTELDTPSADFFVGRTYGILESEFKKKLLESKETENYFRYKAYTSQNCLLVR
jgi:hypothetical protein